MAHRSKITTVTSPLFLTGKLKEHIESKQYDVVYIMVTDVEFWMLTLSVLVLYFCTTVCDLAFLKSYSKRSIELLN